MLLDWARALSAALNWVSVSCTRRSSASCSRARSRRTRVSAFLARSAMNSFSLPCSSMKVSYSAHLTP